LQEIGTNLEREGGFPLLGNQEKLCMLRKEDRTLINRLKIL